MGIVIPEGFSNATVVCTVNGSPREQTSSFGFLQIGLTPPSLQDQVDDIYDFIKAIGRPYAALAFGVDWTIEGVSMTTTVAGLPVVTQHLVPYGGSGSGDREPPNCSAIIRKQTAAGGRKNRGRIYMPSGVLQAAQVDGAGVIDSAVVTGLNTQWENLRVALVAADYVPYLFHSDATAPTVITGFSAESLLATQRRRLRS